MGRREARQLAAQAMYAYAIDASPIESVLDRLFRLENDPEGWRFRVGDTPWAAQLCRATCEHIQYIDDKLGAVVEHWRPERLAVVDRALLRLAACELLYFPEIPPRVTLNEYIDLAKRLGDEQSPAFINGVLQKILEQNPKPDAGELDKRRKKKARRRQ